MPYNATITRTGVDYLVPPDIAKEIIQAVPTTSSVMSLARRLPNMSTRTRTLPILSTLLTAYFVNGDTGLKQTAAAAWTNKVITAEELAVIVPVPTSVLDDSSYDIWTEIRPRLVEAFGAAFDAAVLYGTNAPATWPASLVTGATAAGTTTSLAASIDVFDATLGTNGSLAKVEASGYGITGHVAAMIMKARLRGLRDSTGQPIFLRSFGNADPNAGPMEVKTSFELDGSPILFPINGAIIPALSLLFSGDWTQLVYAIRQDITFTLATEGVINDNTGAIIYNLFQQDMVAMRAVMRLGWQLPNPTNLLQPNAALRYPFGVLTP